MRRTRRGIEALAFSPTNDERSFVAHLQATGRVK